MKGLVLSGGTGTRLRPLTHGTAKQLLPVAGRPVLLRAIDRLVEAGVVDITVVVSPQTGDEVRAAVGDGALVGARVGYVEQPRPSGLADAVRLARGRVGDGDLCLFLGDVLVCEPVVDAVHSFTQMHDIEASLLLSRVARPEAFGVAEVDGSGLVTALAEKPERPRSDLAIAGVYLLRPSIFEAIDRTVPSPRGELEMTAALCRLLEAGARVGSWVTGARWFDVGTTESLLDANEHLLGELRPEAAVGRLVDCVVEGVVTVAEGAVVAGSVLRGPVQIGAHCQVEGATLGPLVSLGRGVSVRGASISRSVLFDGASVEGPAVIERSVLGRRASVRVGARAAVSAVLGDDSAISVDGPHSP